MANSSTKRKIARAFGKAAQNYNKAAVLQQEIAERLVERLSLIELEPKRILDIGAGTGFIAKLLQAKFPEAQIVQLDIALPMLQQARANVGGNNYLAADMEILPLKTGSFDLVISSCTLQWSLDLGASLTEIKRVLTPDGIMLFSTFGPDTLIELRESFAKLDENNHINKFHDMHNFGDLLLAMQFVNPVMGMDRLCLEYDNVPSVLKEIKAMGANLIIDKPRQGLMGKIYFKQLINNYEQFRTETGVPATFEVIYGQAQKSAVD